MALTYLNLPDTNFILDGVLVQGEAKQELANLLYLRYKELRMKLKDPHDWFDEVLSKLGDYKPTDGNVSTLYEHFEQVFFAGLSYGDASVRVSEDLTDDIYDFTEEEHGMFEAKNEQ